MNQNQLKVLLQSVLNEIEAGQCTSIEEVIRMMAQKFNERMPSISEESI